MDTPTYKELDQTIDGLGKTALNLLADRNRLAAEHADLRAYLERLTTRGVNLDRAADIIGARALLARLDGAK